MSSDDFNSPNVKEYFFDQIMLYIQHSEFWYSLDYSFPH